MSIIDRILSRMGWVKAGKQPQYPGWLLADAAAQQSYYPDYGVINNQMDLYNKLSWLNIAVNMVAKSAAVVDLSVMKEQDEDLEEVTNHPFELLLKRPNPLYSRYELIYNTSAYYSLTGNAYWWLNCAGENAEPDEIWCIPPNVIRPVMDEKLYITGYKYTLASGTEYDMQPWEIVHFHGFHPTDMYQGMSNVEPIATVAEGDIGMQQWNTRLFKKSNGMLPGILAFADPIQDGDWKQIKADVDERVRLRQMLMLRNVHAGGVQWIQNNVTQREMEFISGRHANMVEIFNTFAPGLVSMLSENATEANSRTGKATFIEYCIWPMLVNMHEKITSNIMPSYGEGLRAQFDDIRITDRVLKLQEIDAYSRVHTIDEIRQTQYQDEPIGDERGALLPVQVTPPMGAAEPEEPIEQPTEQPVEVAIDDVEPEAAVDADAQAMRDDMLKWQRKSLNLLARGKSPLCEFVTDAIPASQVSRVRQALSGCKNADDVRAVFAPSERDNKSSDISSLLEGIRLGVEALKGGPGSGNWGHAGRPGERGGSEGGGGHAAVGATGSREERLSALSDYQEYRASPEYRQEKETTAAIEQGQAIADRLPYQGAEVVRFSGNGKFEGDGSATEKQQAYAKRIIDNMRDTTIIDERSSNERLNRQNTMMFADSSFRGIAGTHMMSAETNIDLFNGGQDILIQNSNDFAQAMEKIHTAGNNWLQTVAPSRMSRTTASAFIDAAKELNNSAAVMFNAHNISRYDRISEMNKIAGGGFYVWNTPDEINNSRPVRGYGITYISPNIDTSKMIMRDGLYQP